MHSFGTLVVPAKMVRGTGEHANVSAGLTTERPVLPHYGSFRRVRSSPDSVTTHEPAMI